MHNQVKIILKTINRGFFRLSKVKLNSYLSIIIFALIFAGSPVYSFFVDNPASFAVSGNAFSFSTEFYAVGNYTLKFAWQQREGNLSGELGYTTDNTFTLGILNYKLSDLKNGYGFNIKARLLPSDNFSLFMDAGGRIVLNPQFLLEFGISDVTLVNLGTQGSPIPFFYGKADFVYEKNFNAFAGFGYYNGDKLKLMLGFGIFGFPPINIFTIVYTPVYKFLPGEIAGYSLIECNLFLKLSNFDFKFSGFYNVTELLSSDELLRNQYGFKLSVGVNF
ncbi:MAG: hypothetical protein ACK40U_03560 [Fervidobacterium pennivorans]